MSFELFFVLGFSLLSFPLLLSQPDLYSGIDGRHSHILNIFMKADPDDRVTSGHVTLIFYLFPSKHYKANNTGTKKEHR